MESDIFRYRIAHGVKVGLLVAAVALPSAAVVGCADMPSQNSGTEVEQTNGADDYSYSEQEAGCLQVEAEVSDSGCN